MSKIATVRALDDSAPRREQIKTVTELQGQISDLQKQIQTSLSTLDLSLNRRAQVSEQSLEDLRQTLHLWRQAVLETQSTSRQNLLDLAVLIEPVLPTLEAIQQRQAAQDARLAKLEAMMNRVTIALPSLVSKDGRQAQPRLASRDDLAGLPAKVWEAKPPMFGKS